MRNGKRFLVLMLLLAILASGSPSPAYVEGRFCEEPQDITGFGSPQQFRLHYEIFMPAYETRCSRGAGLVSYYTGDDGSVFQRMLYRGAEGDQVDHFWGRDSALSEAETMQVVGDTGRGRGGVSQVGHFPLFVLGISVAYNVSCTKKPINLSALNISLMYLGDITSWNDPRILADNPDNTELAACATDVRLTGRADAAGETLTFKSYLARRNPIWNTYAQPQLNTQWPAPLVCRGGSDVGAAGCVASNSGSIGYVSIGRAKKMGLRVANLERLTASGDAPVPTKVDFVAPSLAGCTAAAESVQIPPTFSSYSNWNLISLVDARQGYPLCYFSFMLAFHKQLAAYLYTASLEQARTLRDYMSTIFSERVQALLATRGFGRVPRKFLELNREGLDQMQAPDCVQPVNIPREVDDYNGCFETFGFLQRKGVKVPPDLP